MRTIPRGLLAIPRRKYFVTYNGELIAIHTSMRPALAQIPDDTRGWRITYLFETDNKEDVTPRVAFQG